MDPYILVCFPVYQVYEAESSVPCIGSSIAPSTIRAAVMSY
jgi:hypothetical protein